MKGSLRDVPWRGVIAVVTLCLAGCAGLPQDLPGGAPSRARVASHAIVASPDTALGAVAARASARVEAQHGKWGVRALPEADFAFDARLEVLRRAQVSIDV